MCAFFIHTRFIVIGVFGRLGQWSWSFASGVSGGIPVPGIVGFVFGSMGIRKGIMQILVVVIVAEVLFAIVIAGELYGVIILAIGVWI